MNIRIILGFLLPVFWLSTSLDAAETARVALITDSKPSRASEHGVTALTEALHKKGIAFTQSSAVQPPGNDSLIVAGLADGAGLAAEMATSLKIEVASKPESLVIRRADWHGHNALLLLGRDDRGLMYALLEAADRIGWAAKAAEPFAEIQDIAESPDVGERGLSIYTMNRRTFEERFFDESYWAAYFDMLARDRFNSFVLIFGYENGGYLAPAYPYFFDVEGFPGVRVIDFTPGQQRRYLRALNKIIEMAHDRGLNFTVGLWDHIYRGGVQAGGVKEADQGKPIPGVAWGLSQTNLMVYSAAALAKFLKLVPHLDTVQFRMHSESGLKPGAEMREFWRCIYQVVKDVRPELQFDARAKEFPDELIDLALRMGIHMRISTKYWAEQMGLPFHPTHINRQNQFDRRHSYADLLRYPKRYGMHWQLWSGGTTRVLLWGDPEYVRRFAESTHLYDGDGFEVNEMLATKMEAQPHDAKPFDLLQPQHRYYKWEFERYWHFYQLFGRISYNPNSSPEIWEHEFRARFGTEAAPYVEKALHQASWILPRINASIFPYNRFPTTRGWVEKQHWEDLPAYASSEGSDTAQFLSFAEAARNLLDGTVSAKLHPKANSAWFARTSREIIEAADEAEKRAGPHRNKEFESTITDLRILANLALYHSRRIEAALEYAIFKQSQDTSTLDEAIAHEGEAVAAWEQLVQVAGDMYSDDLMMGLRTAGLSGHWKDELPLLRQGLLTLREQREHVLSKPSTSRKIDRAIFGEPPKLAHLPVTQAAAGKPLLISATVSDLAGIQWVRVRYRDVTQYEDFKTAEMSPTGQQNTYEVTIPGDQLDPKWDFMYYFEVMGKNGNGRIYPKLEETAPYIIVKLRHE